MRRWRVVVGIPSVYLGLVILASGWLLLLLNRVFGIDFLADRTLTPLEKSAMSFWMAIALSVIGIIWVVVATRKTLILLHRGVRVIAVIVNVGGEYENLVRVDFQYQFNGASYSAATSVVSVIAHKFVADTEIEVVIDPMNPKRFLLAEELFPSNPFAVAQTLTGTPKLERKKSFGEQLADFCREIISESWAKVLGALLIVFEAVGILQISKLLLGKPNAVEAYFLTIVILLTAAVVAQLNWIEDRMTGTRKRQTQPASWYRNPIVAFGWLACLIVAFVIDTKEYQATSAKAQEPINTEIKNLQNNPDVKLGMEMMRQSMEKKNAAKKAEGEAQTPKTESKQ